MDIITGYTGEKHITAEQDRDVNIGIVGKGSYVLCTGMQMEAEISTNNEIKIRDGVAIHQGCAAAIKKNTYDSVTIINGSQGMKRIDLIVARYERNQDTNVESIRLVALQGEPAENNPVVPEYVVGDIQTGDYVADMPMYQVMIDGLNIVEVKCVFEVAYDLKTIQEILAGKQDTITGGASTIATKNLAAKRALLSNSAGKIAVASTTVAELEYLHGVKSNVQTQIDNKNNLRCRTTTHMVAFEWTGDNKFLIIVDNTVVATLKNGTNI